MDAARSAISGGDCEGEPEVSPAPPPAAAAIFGARLGLARQYADLLATVGVERGLIGPREAGRLWDRHLLNCAVVAELIPQRSRLIDVGSGAGLPGIALALARPDLTITLLEPMVRRAAFLGEVVRELRLTAVEVCRARAEDRSAATPKRAAAAPAGQPDCRADVVTARAVAPLDRLAQWCLPLVGTGGCLLAIKGRTAQAEADRHAAAVRRAGGTRMRVLRCGVGAVDTPTTVVEIVRGSGHATRRSTS